MVRPLVDDLVCVAMARAFTAVGRWYRSFEQLSDERVVAALTLARDNASA